MEMPAVALTYLSPTFFRNSRRPANLNTKPK